MTLTTKEILNNVNSKIREMETIKKSYGLNRLYIRDVCEELSIFDWWNETLSLTQLKQMKKFLETAITLGYTGYACFKVGAKYCSHGMWAYKAESTDGYSPVGECIFHSFRSGENYWDAENADGKWMHDGNDRYGFTLAEVKEFISK